MPSYPPMQFTHGVMLGIQRPGNNTGFDPFGDPVDPYVLDHWIGPCDVPVMAMRIRARMAAELRPRAVWDIRAPSESDVRKSDRVWFPAGLIGPVGLVFPIITEPELPINPFTGWQPFVHFQLEEVG